VDPVRWSETWSTVGSLRGSEGVEGLKYSGASLLLSFRRFFVRSTSVKHGSNDVDRTSEGHVELAVIRSMSLPGDDGISKIYSAAMTTQMFQKIRRDLAQQTEKISIYRVAQIKIPGSKFAISWQQHGRYPDVLPACKQSPIQVVTGPSVD